MCCLNIIYYRNLMLNFFFQERMFSTTSGPASTSFLVMDSLSDKESSSDNEEDRSQEILQRATLGLVGSDSEDGSDGESQLEVQSQPSGSSGTTKKNTSAI